MIKRKGQLYWYDDKSNLSEKHIEYMINEGREKLYNKALDYISSLKNVLPPLVLKDFMWVKTEYTVPYFVDLAFSYKNILYGILFEAYGEDGMLSSDPLWPLIKDMCKMYDVRPCILPFDKSGELIIREGKPFPLLDAEKYYEEGLIVEIDPLSFSSDEMREVSLFEMLSSAVIAEVENLINKENVKEILYHTFPDVYPNIFWIDKNKTLNFMVIETVKERDDKPTMPREMLKTIEKSGAYGHYALCEFSNPYATNVFPRGSKFDLRMEITDLE